MLRVGREEQWVFEWVLRAELFTILYRDLDGGTHYAEELVDQLRHVVHI